MKSFVFTALVAIVLSANFAVNAQVNEDAGRSCGTVTTGVPFTTSDLVPASEILLYIRFDATQVVQGSDNAGAFRSSLISGTRNLPPPNLTTEQKNEIVRRVKSDFSPFNVRVTTDLSEFLAYPAGFREMAVVSTSPTVAGFSNGTGGIAPFTGGRIPNAMSFTFSSAFGDNPIDVASTISHETGHLFGLEHQHLFVNGCQIGQEYHPGFGTGSLRFNPIMGSGTGDAIYNWFAQLCPARILGMPQDDYAKIGLSVQNRPDDFPDSPQPFNQIGAGNGVTGVLEQGGDADVLFFNFTNPNRVTVSSHNIDVKVSLVSDSGQVLEVFSDPVERNIVIPQLVGANYLRVEAETNANMSSQFMTGTYDVALFVPTAANASISGRVTTASGRGIANVTLQLTRSATGETVFARSNTFGRYNFADLQSGEAYVLSVSAKRYTFGNPSRVITLSEDLTEVDFVSDSK